MSRSISWPTYLAAFVISAILFSFGILVGVFLTQNVNNGLATELQDLQGRTGELELLLLANASSATLCPFYQTQLRQFDPQTTAFGQKLDVLETTRGRTDPVVQTLKREYMVQQIRDFLLVQRINAQCGTSIPTVLYFYTNDCPECTQQGLVGPPLKQKRPDAMIYALDADLNTPAVEALKAVYGITTYPTLVINGKTVPGYSDQKTVESLLS